MSLGLSKIYEISKILIPRMTDHIRLIAGTLKYIFEFEVHRNYFKNYNFCL